MHPRLRVSLTLTAAMAIAAAPATAQGGQIDATAAFQGTLSGSNEILVAAECTALADPDGDDFPDPLRVSLECTLTQNGRSYDIPRTANVTDDALIRIAGAAGVLRLALEPFSVCVTASAEFADGTTASTTKCAKASEADLSAPAFQSNA